MPSGILLQDEQGRVVFDGTQRIPKILSEVTMNAGDIVKTLTLPRALRGSLYYYMVPIAAQDNEPYYDPMCYNYKVSVTGTQLTVEYIQYASWTTVPRAFKVLVGEF